MNLIIGISQKNIDEIINMIPPCRRDEAMAKFAVGQFIAEADNDIDRLCGLLSAADSDDLLRLCTFAPDACMSAAYLIHIRGDNNRTRDLMKTVAQKIAGYVDAVLVSARLRQFLGDCQFRFPVAAVVSVTEMYADLIDEIEGFTDSD